MTITHKIRIRPMDERSDKELRLELQRSVEAYNMLLHHQIRWAHIRREVWCAPESEVALAAKLRQTPRTGRKPSMRTEIACSGPWSPKARQQNQVYVVSDTSAAAKVVKLREKWSSVEITRSGMTRSDDAELQAAESRRSYGYLRSIGCHYRTIDHANDAATDAVMRAMRANNGSIPDYLSAKARPTEYGRVGVDPEWLEWEGYNVSLCGLRYRASRDQLRQRPVTAWQLERSGVRLDRHVDLVGHKIREAYIVAEREGHAYARRERLRYHLCLVIDVDHAPHAIDAQRGVAAIDLCWRRADSGDTTRVAYVLCDDGAHFPVDMPADIYSRIRHAEHVRGLADGEVDVLRRKLGLHRMTSERKVLRIAEEATDPDVIALRKHAHHLYAYARGGQVSGIRARDAAYMQQIQTLLKSCHTIFVEKLDGTSRDSGLIRRDKDAIAGGQRQITAPLHRWLRVLQREASKYGCNVVEVTPQYTSRVDPHTGEVMPSPGAARMVQVSDGSMWDADRLAAVEIMRRGMNSYSRAAE